MDRVDQMISAYRLRVVTTRCDGCGGRPGYKALRGLSLCYRIQRRRRGLWVRRLMFCRPCYRSPRRQSPAPVRWWA